MTSRPRDIRVEVFLITGKHAGKNWHRNYLKRHEGTLETLKRRRRFQQEKSRARELAAAAVQENALPVASSSESPVEPSTPVLPDLSK